MPKVSALSQGLIAVSRTFLTFIDVLFPSLMVGVCLVLAPAAYRNTSAGVVVIFSYRACGGSHECKHNATPKKNEVQRAVRWRLFVEFCPRSCAIKWPLWLKVVSEVRETDKKQEKQAYTSNLHTRNEPNQDGS